MTVRRDIEAEVAALWRDRRPAAALDLVASLAAPAPWLARLWMQVGSRRALTPLLDGLEPDLRGLCERFIAEGPTAVAIPRGGRGELEALAADLAGRGLVHELAHCHLGLAELDLRVDERVGHVESAAALGAQLGDARLLSLTAAYEARLDAFLGEDEEARERVEAAHTSGLEQNEPRAVVVAEVVRAILDADRDGYARAVVALEEVGLRQGFGLIWRET